MVSKKNVREMKSNLWNILVNILFLGKTWNVREISRMTKFRWLSLQ